MIPTNRPITSREYKLMLNTERFRDRRAGAALFWKLLTFLVENQGNTVLPTSDDPDQDVEKRRVTYYLDTPDYALRRADLTLRIRQETAGKKPYKTTLKARAPDRYTAAGFDLSCTQKVKADDNKFEEDVLPPFMSRFAASVSLKTEKSLQLETIGDLAELFAGIGQLDLAKTMPLRVVNGFHAHEVLHYLGKLKLDKQPTTRGAKAPDFVIKVALNHWYLRDDEDDYPLVTEFSFSCDAVMADTAANQLELFPPTIIAGANRLFRDLQNQAGWLAQFGTTKTAYVFDVL
ncbi:MAG: hypothetical protein R3C14_36935 [Caldilineaceae bacterium]